ncbi:MAG TPA: YciI family protein [Lapillicoccus sp.]|nr:YciI family protein [Lapillicoccus sp.]
MEFLVLIAYEDSGWDSATAEERQEFFDAHHAFEQAVYARGRLVSGAALADADRGFTVRHDGGGWQRTEGPFAETAEQIGGFYLLEMPDERAAQEAVQHLPRQYTLEVRPVVDIDGYERSDPPA